MGSNEQIDQTLTKFTSFFSQICEQKLFNDLLITITGVSNTSGDQLARGSLTPEVCDQHLKTVIEAAKQAKRHFGGQISELHKHLSAIVIALDNTNEPPEALNRKIKALSTWLVAVRVEVDQKRASNSLIDFYNELENLQIQYQDLQRVSDDLKEKNKQYRAQEAEHKKKISQQAKDIEKMGRKNEKILQSFEDLKNTYGKLYAEYQELLKQKGPQANPNQTEVTYMKEREGSPSKDNTGIWFDIEKSQQRYEALLDQHLKLIKEKDERIRELEDELQSMRSRARNFGDQQDHEFDRLADKVRQLEKENLDLRDACIKLKKALDDKQDQLSNSNMLNGEVMDLKEKLRDYELNRSRQRDENDGKLKQLEDKNKALEDKLLKALQRESNYLSGRTDAKDLMNSALLNNRDQQEEYDRIKYENNDLLKEAKDLQRLNDDLEDELSNLKKEYEDLNVLTHEKEIEVERLRDELQKLRKRDDKNRKQKDQLGKQKVLQEQELSDKDANINQLQRQLETQEAKLINMAKLIDRLRFENEKFKTNYRLTSTFSPKKSGELPPTMRDLSPEPLRIPPSNLSRDRSGSREKSTGRSYTRTSPEVLRSQAAVQSDEIYTFAFIKAANNESLSPYLYREENKLVIAGPAKGSPYDRTPSGDFLDKRQSYFKGIFTQHELDLMGREVQNIFNNHRDNLMIVYGSPLNIKLFVMHKAISVFLGGAKMAIEGGGRAALEMVLEEGIADFVMTHFKEEASTGLITRNSYRGAYKMLRLDSKIPYLIDSLKKLFFNILSNNSAKMLDFVALELIEDGVSAGQGRLVILRSSIDRALPPGKSMEEVTHEFVYSSKFKDIDDLLSVLRDFQIEYFAKQFFLILEPGKVSTYEDSYNFLEVHNAVENCRLNSKARQRGKSGVLYNQTQ